MPPSVQQGDSYELLPQVLGKPLFEMSCKAQIALDPPAPSVKPANIEKKVLLASPYALPPFQGNAHMETTRFNKRLPLHSYDIETISNQAFVSESH